MMIPVSASGFWELVLTFVSGVIVLPVVIDFVKLPSQTTPAGDKSKDDPLRRRD
jgi:hypothetical protein